LIDPKIPAGWPGYKVKRVFRGSVYDIQVKNPGHVSTGVRSVYIDGRKIKGNLIPVLASGKNYKIVVTM